METWNISYTLNKTVICPGDNVIVNLEIYNPNKEHCLYIDKIYLKSEKYLNYCYEIKKVVSPVTRENLALLKVPIPIRLKGEVDVKLSVDTYKLTYKKNLPEIDKFENFGRLVRKGPIKFYISPTPCYRAFVSRSIHTIDKPTVEPIVKIIQDWGFETNTVGINIFTENHRDPTDTIIEEIIKSDCLVGIATIRDQSAFTGFYITLQWLYTEVSFAYFTQKPILLIAEQGVNLQGILAAKKWPIIIFNKSQMKRLEYELDEILPLFRLAVQKKRVHNFEKFLNNIQQRAKQVGYWAGLEQKRIEASSSGAYLGKL